MRDRWKKKAYYTVVLILTALCLISGCGQESGEELKEISLEETQKEKEESSAEEKKAEDKESKKETKIFVYLCGAVGKPGVYEADSDDRLYEVIAMAGGLTAEAAQDAVNQARVVVDGEQIYIPTKEEMQTQAAQPGESPAEGTKLQDGKVNLNTATKEELMTLSGVGESRADSIIAYREENGRFQNTEELMQISGIKEGLYNKIKDNITV